MHVYLDESGDTGWKFSEPYRQGGSSRFLCLAFLFVPHQHRKIPKRIISDMYLKYQWKDEQKCSLATRSQKMEFSCSVTLMLSRYPDIRAECIIAKKENVREHIRKDPNKLYNYMCGLIIPDYVGKEHSFKFVPDKRSIKVESGNSLSDYIQTLLWFQHQYDVILINEPQESHKNYNLQCADWLANCIWSRFENFEDEAYQELSKHVKVRKLFFD